MNWLDFFEEPLLCLICLVLFLLITTGFLVLYSFPGPGRKKRSGTDTVSSQGVSIIVSAKNEYERLKLLLPALLEQDYPEFEIIVVNKHSEDDTEILLASLEHFHNNLKIRSLNADAKYGQDNMMAIGVGIRAATHPYIVFFRPDAMPSGPQWLSSLMACYCAKNKQVILGHTFFARTNRFIRYEMMDQELSYMAMARIRLAYASNGFNTVFPKNLFFSENGFDSRTTGRHIFEQAVTGHIIRHNNTKPCTDSRSVITLTRTLNRNEWHLLRIHSLRTHLLTGGWPYFLLTLEKTLTAAFYVVLFYTLYALFRDGHPLSAVYSAGLLGTLLILRWTVLWICYARFHRIWQENNLTVTAPLWDMVAPFFHWYFLICLFIKSLKDR